MHKLEDRGSQVCCLQVIVQLDEVIITAHYTRMTLVYNNILYHITIINIGEKF